MTQTQTNTAVCFETRPGKGGYVGLITLNRPDQLNALNLAMCEQLLEQLTLWQDNDDIKAVVIQGIGDRAFCAGGDLRFLYQLRQQHKLPEDALAILRCAYALNRLMHSYQKPFISLTHGITMGGGVGVSIGASHRIADPNTRWAMPETGIGFFPDVGASYFLNRYPHEFGTFIGLTGCILNTADTDTLGIAPYRIGQRDFPELIDQIAALPGEPTHIHQQLDALFTRLSQPVPSHIAPTLSPHTTDIQACFAHNDMADIITALTANNTPWANAVLTELQCKSPTSLKVTLAQLRRGKALSFAECSHMEYHMSQRFLQGHDFYEGIRAAIIDKDRQPHWQPNTLSAVSDHDVAAYFEPIRLKSTP